VPRSDNGDPGWHCEKEIDLRRIASQRQGHPPEGKNGILPSNESLRSEKLQERSRHPGRASRLPRPYRQNNVPVYDVAKGRYRSLPKYTPHGVPDILAIKDGTPIFIEVKSQGGRQTESQKQFEGNARRAGAQYILARGIEDLQAAGL
jgi:hypothetical protein